MRLVTFEDEAAGRRIGVHADDGALVDLAAAAPDLPRDMLALIRLGAEGLGRVRAAIDSGLGRAASGRRRLVAPIPRPARNVFCVGKNYHEHAREFHGSGFDASAGGQAIPDVPIVFTKPSSCVIGPDEAIPAHLDPTHSVDYEGELTVVIGEGGRGISAGDAYRHVYGYTLINDVTARTLQHRHKQWFLGKSIDGFCPMGPALLTADAIADVTALRLETRVNGELRQSATVSQLIFDIPTLIETISAGITLEPGDLIATGTPAGVGIGFDPPRYLQAGDRVDITMEPIGTLSNPVR
ncbi:MAG: fumarylacetoacetate hydrolase family protein [Ectothiorhodospiraceae bacterium]|nr:fumarylacetoacetate hydrolase family protein [Ectothiorhodospiraceae bacterium]